jgi:hypothetical protein
LVGARTNFNLSITELDDQHAREVERGCLTSLFAPQAMKGLLIPAHDDPGIGAPDKFSTINSCCAGHHTFLWKLIIVSDIIFRFI